MDGGYASSRLGDTVVFGGGGGGGEMGVLYPVDFRDATRRVRLFGKNGVSKLEIVLDGDPSRPKGLCVLVEGFSCTSGSVAGAGLSDW